MSSYSSSDVNNDRSLLDGSNRSQQAPQQNIILVKKPSTETKATEIVTGSHTELPEPLSLKKDEQLPQIVEEKVGAGNKIQDSSSAQALINEALECFIFLTKKYDTSPNDEQSLQSVKKRKKITVENEREF